MLRTILLVSLVAAAAPARAGDGRPGRWEAHLGAGVGAARVAMLGSDHGALAASIDLEAIRYSDPNTGFGLYLGEVIGEPWTQVHMDGHPVVRELPWIIAPEIVHRSLTRHAQRWLATGWTASLGAGAVLTRTSEEWSHLLSTHSNERILEHGVAAGTTAQLTAFVHAGPLAIAAGPRVWADTDGDVAFNLEATAGGAW